MATFDVTINALDYSSAELSGSFSGGDPVYSYHRRLSVTIYHGSGILPKRYFYSREPSGADNTFSGVIDGLQSGAYTWRVTLQYVDVEGWRDSSYTDSGAFEIPVPPPAEDVIIWVYTGGQWKPARPWIYTSGWKQAEPWIYSGRWRN